MILTRFGKLSRWRRPRTINKVADKARQTNTQFIFAEIVASFSGDSEVAFKEGKGFGSNALKVRGKIFAMISSKGKLTVKLSAARATFIVDESGGDYFNPGHGRKMKQWIELRSVTSEWAELVWEARRYVGCV